jgi:hypothetical protein
MKCEVCGREYGLSHQRPGPLSAGAQSILTADLQAPVSAGLGHYLGEAMKIVRRDDTAIRRNLKDPRATILWLARLACINACGSGGDSRTSVE